MIKGKLSLRPLLSGTTQSDSRPIVAHRTRNAAGREAPGKFNTGFRTQCRTRLFARNSESLELAAPNLSVELKFILKIHIHIEFKLVEMLNFDLEPSTVE